MCDRLTDAGVRDLTPDDVPALCALYEEYEWWANRDIDNVSDAFAATEVAVGVEITDDLVAAGRVLTDYIYYATVYDVIVAADHRGEGYGTILLEGIVNHPDLQRVAELSLLCRQGLIPFYERVGFEIVDPIVENSEGRAEAMVRMVNRQDGR